MFWDPLPDLCVLARGGPRDEARDQPQRPPGPTQPPPPLPPHSPEPGTDTTSRGRSSGPPTVSLYGSVPYICPNALSVAAIHYMPINT